MWAFRGWGGIPGGMKSKMNGRHLEFLGMVCVCGGGVQPSHRSLHGSDAWQTGLEKQAVATLCSVEKVEP